MCVSKLHIKDATLTMKLIAMISIEVSRHLKGIKPQDFLQMEKGTQSPILHLKGKYTHHVVIQAPSH